MVVPLGDVFLDHGRVVDRHHAVEVHVADRIAHKAAHGMTGVKNNLFSIGSEQNRYRPRLAFSQKPQAVFIGGDISRINSYITLLEIFSIKRITVDDYALHLFEVDDDFVAAEVPCHFLGAEC